MSQILNIRYLQRLMKGCGLRKELAPSEEGFGAIPIPNMLKAERDGPLTLGQVKVVETGGGEYHRIELAVNKTTVGKPDSIFIVVNKNDPSFNIYQGTVRDLDAWIPGKLRHLWSDIPPERPVLCLVGNNSLETYVIYKEGLQGGRGYAFGYNLSTLDHTELESFRIEPYKTRGIIITMRQRDFIPNIDI